MAVLPGIGVSLGWFAGAPPLLIGVAASGASSVSSLTATIPNGVLVGDLIVIWAAVEAGAARTITTPTGYTLQTSRTTAQVNLQSSYLFTKVATGGEGTSIALAVGGGTGNPGAVVFLLRGASTVECSAFSAATSANCDPPSLTPAFGAVPAIWLGLMAAQNASMTAYPTGYDIAQALYNATAPCIAGAGKLQTIATDDPGTFTRGGSNGWHALTVAIKGT